MIRYLLGEELMITQDDRGLILMRAPSEEERLFVGHVCFDNRVEMGSGVLGLHKWPLFASHVSMDRAVRGTPTGAPKRWPLSDFGVVMWSINN